MAQQILAFESRQGYSFADYLPAGNQHVIDLLSGFIDTARDNTVFLWGDSGLGKTHLLHACCQSAAQQGKQVQFVSLAQCLNSQPALFNGLERSQLLCIDDINLITSHPDWEIALFNLFNALMERSHQLIVSANNAPAALPFFLADLQSRLSSGLILHLLNHDDESKRKLLQFRARQLGMIVPDQVSRYLMQRFNRELNELWSILDKLEHETLVNKHKLTLPFVKQVLES
ncbi:MAG: DnaA regulatory inactivator Hda [Gammaproteobacteria bacterium]|nr:DnaA regulatory inactivator Hda [Gammaproteobacteria bacterium]